MRETKRSRVVASIIHNRQKRNSDYAWSPAVLENELAHSRHDRHTRALAKLGETFAAPRCEPRRTNEANRSRELHVSQPTVVSHNCSIFTRERASLSRQGCCETVGQLDCPLQTVAVNCTSYANTQRWASESLASVTEFL